MSSYQPAIVTVGDDGARALDVSEVVVAAVIVDLFGETIHRWFEDPLVYDSFELQINIIGRIVGSSSGEIGSITVTICCLIIHALIPVSLLPHHLTDYNSLTALMKEISLKIVNNGGIVRSIQNQGVRQLPHRFKAKYADRDGNRYYEKGRFISVFYDASPSVMRQVEGILNLDEQILRNTHLKARNKFMDVNARENKNPYVQEIIREEESMKK